jgi:hypothetical protein
MPRAKGNGSAPSAGARFVQPRGNRANGKLLALSDICEAEQLWSLANDCVECDVAITISRTRDGSSLCVSFFADGERSPWYLTSREDWTDLVSTTAV